MVQAWKGDDAVPPAVRQWQQDGIRNDFSGYELGEEGGQQATVLAVAADESVALIHPCPFYARGGGQVRVLTLKTPLTQSALQHSVVDVWSSALNVSWSPVLCGPYPKESVRLVQTTPTAHFE